MTESDADGYDWRKQGDRRKESDRRGGERRGVLRWDPVKKERRTGGDRRKNPPEREGSPSWGG